MRLTYFQFSSDHELLLGRGHEASLPVLKQHAERYRPRDLLQERETRQSVDTRTEPPGTSNSEYKKMLNPLICVLHNVPGTPYLRASSEVPEFRSRRPYKARLPIQGEGPAARLRRFTHLDSRLSG